MSHSHTEKTIKSGSSQPNPQYLDNWPEPISDTTREKQKNKAKPTTKPKIFLNLYQWFCLQHLIFPFGTLPSFHARMETDLSLPRVALSYPEAGVRSCQVLGLNEEVNNPEGWQEELGVFSPPVRQAVTFLSKGISCTGSFRQAGGLQVKAHVVTTWETSL